MADIVGKNIGTFAEGTLTPAFRVVCVAEYGPAVDADPILVDPAELGGTGPSAYQVAVAEGFIGTEDEWLDSLKGEKGDTGTPGTNGQDGAFMHFGNGVPSGALGVDGDLYTDNLTAFVYQKQAGAYVYQYTARGPAGEPGTPGTDGQGDTMRFGSGVPLNSIGIDGDSYVNTDNGNLYEKTGGVYIYQLNIKGPKGDKGDMGAGLVPDEYGNLDEAKVAAIEAAGVSWVFVVNPEGDDRADNTQPPGINGDMSLHILRYDPGTDAWRDFGQFTGIRGEKGEPGTDGTPGNNGADGTDGAPGTDGEDGASAYDIAVANGFVGNQAEWLASLKGDKGDVPLTTLRTVAGTAYTLALIDAEKLLLASSNSTKTFTIPTSATVNFPYAANGETTTISGINTGTSMLNIAVQSGVALLYKSGYIARVAPRGTFILTKIADDTWHLTGDLEYA